MKNLWMVCTVVFFALGSLSAKDSDKNWPLGEVERKNRKNAPLALSFEPFYVPLMWIKEDLDGGEPNGGRVFDADLNNGTGYGGRIGLRKRGVSTGLGIFYLHTRNKDKTTWSNSYHYLAALEMLGEDRGKLAGFDIRYYGAVGVGGARFDFSHVIDDSTGAMAMARTGVQFLLTEGMDIGLGVGGFGWGEPQETEGYGIFATVNFHWEF